MEFPRRATKKNVNDFYTKNPNIKQIIDNVVNTHFINDDLIIDDCGFPYDKIIKYFIRNYEYVSEQEIYNYLIEYTENKTRLYRISITTKTDYYISLLKSVTNEILYELNNDIIKDIKLSDRINMDSNMINAICKFVESHFDHGFNPYEDCVKEVQNSNVTHILFMGKFIRTFIDENNLIWEENGIILYKPKHIKIDFHCYGCNNNTDVLFTKEDHDFSFSTMKYDFEDGYIKDVDKQQKTSKWFNIFKLFK